MEVIQTFLRPRERTTERSTWRRYVIVVAEKTLQGWSAWFRDDPRLICAGNSGLLAVLSLVETYGSVDMDAWDMVKLDERSSEGHLEYLLPGAVR